MNISIILLLVVLWTVPSTAAPVAVAAISPTFTASNYQYIDNNGVFLRSPNGTFVAAISNPSPELKRFYFSVFHAASHSLIWTANRNSHVSESAKLSFTAAGLALADSDPGNTVVWSTPALKSPASSLRLLDSGNLVVLDAENVSLWQSFDHPTDTIVAGQRLPVGSSLAGSVSDTDLSVGSYKFSVTNSDAVLAWHDRPYWKMSMDTKAFQNSNGAVSYMSMNGTGLYLIGSGGGSGSEVVVFRVVLESSTFKMARLRPGGEFVVIGGDDSVGEQFAAPADDCRIPDICGGIKVCSPGIYCSCPQGFRTDNKSDGSCVPAATSYSLPSPNSCNSTIISSFSYLELSYGIDYFDTYFSDPTAEGLNSSACQDLCSKNCSCLAIFHDSSLDSCYLIEDQLGSIIMSSSPVKDRFGYIKVVRGSSASENFDRRNNFPIAGLVLLPTFGFFLLIIFVGLVVWKRSKISRTAAAKFGRSNSSSSDELEIISIPGLPVKFNYDELVAATDNFKTNIGSGGFGTVYKGTLPDKTMVAVKKITNLGVRGKKEFCTEIAIIGNIHHVNLVRLKGFCAFRRQRFLVYEYMNRGSLACVLFGSCPVLGWAERLEIALGTARALAYLHNGCEHKIIHCDVKPENILLHEHLQVKISDFGLSKLLSPEQSSLFTTMRGTRGYLAPEWLTSSAITDKTDVYSYGMVLLELIRGRKNCAMQTQQQSQSVENAKSSTTSLLSSVSSETFSRSRTPTQVYFPLLALEMHEEGRYEELADPRLEEKLVLREELEKLVRVALCCVHEDPTLRPTMVNVVGMLEGGLPVSVPRIESLNFLRFYGRGFTEPSVIGSNRRLNLNYNSRSDSSNRQRHNGINSSDSGSCNSASFMTSQQVSGPR